MRFWQLLVAIFIATANPNVAKAAIRPSFSLDRCAWEASHIVLVTEEDKIDGVVEVLESWKGDLKKADRLTIPDLAEFAPKDSRKVSLLLFAREKTELPDFVTCQRMVLFLMKKQEKSAPHKPAKAVWGPVGMWQQMRVSVAWIEKDKAYAFAQQINPGPSLLIPWDMTERAFRQRVEKVVKTHTALNDAVALDDSEKISAAVLALVKSSPEFTREMIVGLRDAGPKALPALRKMLKDDSLGYLVPEAMAKAGGASVGAELTEVLKHELAFWKKTSPTLQKGWWNGAGLNWENVDPLRNRYSKAMGVLRALQDIRFAPSREAVIDFRDHWRSIPQLREVGNDQMAQACDEVLKALPK